MKKAILSMVIIIAIIFTSCKNDSKKETNTNNSKISNKMTMTETSFGVRGNCGMCKRTIEKAVNNIEGIANVIWDKNKKKIDVSFNKAKTNEMAIHKAIAASGYDTDKVLGNEEAYKGLPGCCKYDHSMEMSIK